MREMRSRQKIVFIAAIVGFVLVFAVVCLWGNYRPSYSGQTIDRWFVDLNSDSVEKRKAAEVAFEEMGADSLDFLVSQVTAERPSMLQKTRLWVSDKVLG